MLCPLGPYTTSRCGVIHLTRTVGQTGPDGPGSDLSKVFGRRVLSISLTIQRELELNPAAPDRSCAATAGGSLKEAGYGR